MKVISISASPLMDKGNTAKILLPFLDGMKDAGAEVEIFYTRRLTINPCQGDIGCWVKTPGRCHQNDDMAMLLPRMADADVWVLAAPLYMDGVPGPLKTVLDRLLPLAQPFMEVYNDLNYHLSREPVKTGKLVVVANCGFWELEHFNPLLTFIQAFCRNVRREFGGALLRPHGPAMRFISEEKKGEIFSAAKKAGFSLVESGAFSPDLAAVVAQPLFPRDQYIAMINAGFQDVLNARGLL